MRIAVFHELHSGGARRAANELARELKKKHVVDLFTTVTDIEELEKKNYSAVFTYYFPEKKWRGKNWKVRIYKDTIEIFNLLRLHRRIARKINSFDYDTVVVHPSKFSQAPFLLKFLNKKAIYYCQEPLRISYESEIVQGSSHDFFRSIHRKVTDEVKKRNDFENVDSADVIITNSKFSRQNIKKVYGRDSTICYLGVDTRLFKPSKKKKIYDLLFIGNKTQLEGYTLLQEAMKILKQKPRLYFLQSGSKWKVTDRKLSEIYNSSKITLALARNEPFGLIPLESMACGVPVIAVDEGGYKETVMDNKTGLLVGRDPAELAQAIKKLLLSKNQREMLGRDGRREVLEHWTWKRSGIKLEKLLNKTANEG